MGNEDVFHVKKRGIMMRVRVPEELRQLIINTMVNYVADGEDLDSKSKSRAGSGSGAAEASGSGVEVDAGSGVADGSAVGSGSGQ
jgi:hypothetical protein